MKLISQIISTSSSSMSIINSKEWASGPKANILKLRFDYVKYNWNSVFIIISHYSLMSIRSIRHDNSVSLACKFSWFVILSEDYSRIEFHFLLYWLTWKWGNLRVDLLVWISVISCLRSTIKSSLGRLMKLKMVIAIVTIISIAVCITTSHRIILWSILSFSKRIVNVSTLNLWTYRFWSLVTLAKIWSWSLFLLRFF
jgi:hypothetical protein